MAAPGNTSLDDLLVTLSGAAPEKKPRRRIASSPGRRGYPPDVLEAVARRFLVEGHTQADIAADTKMCPKTIRQATRAYIERYGLDVSPSAPLRATKQ